MGGRGSRSLPDTWAPSPAPFINVICRAVQRSRVSIPAHRLSGRAIPVCGGTNRARQGLCVTNIVSVTVYDLHSIDKRNIAPS